MKILIVDDKQENLEAWKILLSDVRVSKFLWIRWWVQVDIVGTFNGAIDYISKNKYDIVLTDLNMPVEPNKVYNESCTSYNANELVPYWYMIASLAQEHWVRRVAIVTDANHHSNAIVAAHSQLKESWSESTSTRSGYIIINGRKNLMDGEGPTRWDKRLSNINMNRKTKNKPEEDMSFILGRYTYIKALQKLLSK